jgi:hypothetical protein
MMMMMMMMMMMIIIIIIIIIHDNLFKDLYFIQSPQVVLQVTSVEDHALRRVRKIVKMDH